MTASWTPSIEFLIENPWGGALEFSFLTHFRVYIWTRDHIFRATGLQFFGEPHMRRTRILLPGAFRFIWS